MSLACFKILFLGFSFFICPNVEASCIVEVRALLRSVEEWEVLKLNKRCFAFSNRKQSLLHTGTCSQARSQSSWNSHLGKDKFQARLYPLPCFLFFFFKWSFHLWHILQKLSNFCLVIHLALKRTKKKMYFVSRICNLENEKWENLSWRPLKIVWDSISFSLADERLLVYLSIRICKITSN